MGDSKGSNKSTEIKKCNCKHEFQDSRYGLGMRVHNPNGKGDYKCTVCSNIKKSN